jgi:uncharacterized membrane protein YeaQ/YmgE (transglycosylase-associated protein family)
MSWSSFFRGARNANGVATVISAVCTTVKHKTENKDLFETTMLLDTGAFIGGFVLTGAEKDKDKNAVSYAVGAAVGAVVNAVGTMLTQAATGLDANQALMVAGTYFTAILHVVASVAERIEDKLPQDPSQQPLLVTVRVDDPKTQYNTNPQVRL